MKRNKVAQYKPNTEKKKSVTNTRVGKQKMAAGQKAYCREKKRETIESGPGRHKEARKELTGQQSKGKV